MKPFNPARTQEVRRRADRAAESGSAPEAVPAAERQGKPPVKGRNVRKRVPGQGTPPPPTPTSPVQRPTPASAATSEAAAPLRRSSGLSRSSLRPKPTEPRRSKAEEAYLAIRNAIMDGTLPPGTALDKPAICRDLRLSRFPVTSAIARLAYERLVDVEPQRGSFVSRIAARDARELMLVRRGIEIEIAGEAALRLDEEAVAMLARILRYQQAALEAGDFQDFHRLDHAFHDQIIADLGFGRAGEILEGIRLRVERARRILLPVPGRMQRTFDEHKAIQAGIAAHDADAARRAMRDHLQRVLDEFDVLAREKPDLFSP